MTPELPQDLPDWAGLAATFGTRASRAESHLARVRGDASPVPGQPQAWVSPRNREEVRELVLWARRHRVPLVARGAGTSLDGESVAWKGGVAVDFSGMDRVLEIRPADQIARVEPGVVNASLQAILGPLGLFFPPNPGSWMTSTVGGNVGTNASGFRSFRYGPTRRWVTGLEGVLGSGETFETGTLSRKRSAGPDPIPLLVGSEGTLALFTEITVRLAPIPPRRFGVLVDLPGSVASGTVARAFQGRGDLGLSAVEWVDRSVARVLATETGWSLEGAHGALLLEVEASPETEGPLWDALGRELAGMGIPGPPRRIEDADRFWKARGRAGELLDREMGPRIREDVGVPLSQWDQLLERLDEVARRHGIPWIAYAHLGEGNLHPNFRIDPASPEAVAVRGEVWAAARDLGGTVSAEHGMGALKGAHFEEEHGRTVAAMLRSLKRDCDPDGILNPGKLYGPVAGPP